MRVLAVHERTSPSSHHQQRRSWRGIDNGSKSSFGGYMLRVVGVERGQHLPSGQPKKHHRENRDSSGDGAERAR